MLEKLKSLDKKVWIGIAAAVVAVIAIVLVLVFTLGSSDGDADNTPTGGATTSTSTDTEDTGTTDGDDKTTSSSKGDGTTGSTVSGTSTGATTGTTNKNGSANTQPSNNSSTSGQTPNSSNNPPATTVTDPPITTDPDGHEIVGSGTANDPYLRFPNDDMTVRTLSVPAGKSLHYSIYRVGGKVLTINSGSAYVVHGGVRYNAVGGVVTLHVEDALASDAVAFEIGNTGSSAASFTLSFADPAGNYQNPVVVKSVSSTNSIHLDEGDDNGYYYKYIAEKSGTIRLYLTSSVDAVMLITNNATSAQRTTESDAQSNAQGTYLEMEVSAGDEIIINVGAIPNKRGKYPAVDITWNGEFA